MLKETYDEQYRPTFHFTEKETFINDPNGLVYDSNTGIYHMFYQYHPGITAEGSLYWGHAVSKDLVRWERKEIAIEPDEKGVIFSGSCVVDEKNDSGLFPDMLEAGSRLVAIFTYHSDNPSIAIAYSTDYGETWKEYGKVIANENNMYSNHFRDPTNIRRPGSNLGAFDYPGYYEQKHLLIAMAFPLC